MKRYVISILVFLFSVTNLYSQNGWTIVHPFPNTSENFYDIHFVNNQSGYLVTGQFRNYPLNGYGRIYKTTNSGLNWNRILLDTNGNMTSIYFINNLTGFVSGPKLYKTTDAGITWVYKGQGHGRMSFVDSFTGYACGHTDGSRTIISKTTNGGDNWVDVTTDLTGYYLNMYGIHFFNANTGLISGEGLVIAKTTNGGFNWIDKHPRWWGIYWDMAFVNDSVGFVTGNNSDSLILRTSNYGESWFPVISPVIGLPYQNRILFTNNSNGFCAGDLILRTSNQGLNWVAQNNPLDSFERYPPTLNGIDFANNLTGYLVGDEGSLLNTTDAGNNWGVMIRGDTLKAISFMNNNTGFCGGYRGTLFKTVDGGTNWFQINSGTSFSINDLTFNDSLNGIYVGNAGIVGRTFNSGTNWVSTVINSQVNLNDVKFYTGSAGFIVGTKGKIYKTTNLGTNWTEKNSGTNLNLNSACITDLKNAFAVGDSGMVLRSLDSAETWTINYVSSRIKLNSVAFLNNIVGYIAADSGKLYKTMDNGLSWLLQPRFTSNSLNYIKFTGSTTGYAVGNAGLIIKTTNGGIYWGSQEDFYIGSSINKIFAFDSLNVFVSGNDGYIIRTTDGGGNMTLLSINQYSNLMPKAFYLHQNYPNPFNPSTKIKFDIPSVGNGRDRSVKLIIYDIIGREVATLVNEQLKPGSYEVQWDGSNYASGIYFYQLVTEQFTETKRMVLIK